MKRLVAVISITLISLMMNLCPSSPNSNGTPTPAASPVASPAASPKPPASPVGSPSPVAEGPCEKRETAVIVTCSNVSCKGKCVVFEDGKRLGPSQEGDTPFNRREGSKYECKCE